MTTNDRFRIPSMRRPLITSLLVVIALVCGPLAFTPVHAAQVSISGQVTSEGAVPLAGVRVVAYADYDHDDVWHSQYVTVTDASGNYDLPVLAHNYVVGFEDAAGVHLPEYWDDQVAFGDADVITVWGFSAEHIDAQLKPRPSKPVPLRPLSNYGRPHVEGFSAVGQTLHVIAGRWAPVAVGLTWQWLRAGTPVAGATGSTYKVTAADMGATISVRETASSPGWLPSEVMSKPSAVIRWTAQVAATSKPGKKKATLRIKVTSRGGKPTGTVTIKLRYKKIKTVKLKDGKATVTLKKLKGKRRYTVQFNGSSTMYPQQVQLWVKPKK